MTAENFDRSLAKVLVHEGGYVNHPADPGGETNKGVTFRTYNAYRQRKGLPPQSVRYISDTELKEIYRFQYWNNCLCDMLPKGVDYVVFDGAVNSGPKQSIIWLQQALNLRADGSVGQGTLYAVENCNDIEGLIANICSRRMAFLRSLRTWSTFGTGWTSRLSGVKATGLAMAREVPAPRIAPMADGSAKAPPQFIERPATAETVRDTSAATSVATEVANQLMPFQDYSNVIRGVVVALVLLAAVAAIYAIWKKRKADKAASGEAMADVPDYEEKI